MIRFIKPAEPATPSDVQWGALAPGATFEGEYDGVKGIFLRIPSGLVGFVTLPGLGMRNWIRDSGTAKLTRFIHLDCTVKEER